MKKLLSLLGSALLLLFLAGCGDSEDAATEANGEAAAKPVSVQETPAYPTEDTVLVPYEGRVEHLFFHPVIAYPEMAFDGDYMTDGFDDWMVTAGEYKAILQSLYENNYILVNMNDVWSEYTDENGQKRMKANTLMLPEGKKPLIVSYDDVNYYTYMQENGFAYKLILGDDGNLWSWGLDPFGEEVVSQDLDAITIMDCFVAEHPDFSLYGAKGCLCLTGYEGILGYRTQSNEEDNSEAAQTNRQKEIEAVKPIVQRLKDTGWYFGCHTWGHLNLGNRALAAVQEDMTKWMNEVSPLVGETTLFFYPYGARADGDDLNQTGSILSYLEGLGFEVFSSVGIESYSKIKTDSCAVVCDRLHPDGTTLRWQRSRYLPFFDAQEVMDLKSRPNRGYDFSR